MTENHNTNNNLNLEQMQNSMNQLLQWSIANSNSDQIKDLRTSYDPGETKKWTQALFPDHYEEIRRLSNVIANLSQDTDTILDALEFLEEQLQDLNIAQDIEKIGLLANLCACWDRFYSIQSHSGEKDQVLAMVLWCWASAMQDSVEVKQFYVNYAVVQRFVNALSYQDSEKVRAKAVLCVSAFLRPATSFKQDLNQEQVQEFQVQTTRLFQSYFHQINGAMHALLQTCYDSSPQVQRKAWFLLATAKDNHLEDFYNLVANDDGAIDKIIKAFDPDNITEDTQLTEYWVRTIQTLLQSDYAASKLVASATVKSILQQCTNNSDNFDTEFVQQVQSTLLRF